MSTAKSNGHRHPAPAQEDAGAEAAELSGRRGSLLRVPWFANTGDRARLRTLARQQEAIAEVGRQYPGEVDADRLLQKCAELVARTLEVEACAILESLPKDGRFIVRAETGLPPVARTCTLSDSSQSLAGRALRSTEPIVAAQKAGKPEGTAEEEDAFHFPVRACLEVTIGSHDERPPYGVLAAYSTRADRTFTPDDVFFLQFIADTVAGTIERARQETAFFQGETRYRRIVAHTPGMVYQLRLRANGSFSFPFVTEGCQELFGFEPQHIYDDPMTIIGALYEEDRNSFFPAIRTSAKSLAPLVWTGRYFTLAGETRWLRADSRPERQANGDVVWDGIMYDVSELKRAQQAIAATKEEAEKANRAKSEFLSRISHELRTPLNAILGFSQFLQRQQTASGVNDDCLAHITKAGTHLLGLINEVLDISRIESGHVCLATMPVALGAAIAEAFALVRTQADERGIGLELVRPREVRELRVLADPQRLKQVLINLLTNAVKYNRNGGGVRVACRRLADDPREPPSVEIAISDDGPGIPADKLGRLFIAFDRLGAESSSVQGTGLGLALTKCLVEALGGRITVETELGRGTTFRVRLPAGEPEASRPAEPKVAEALSDPGLVFTKRRRIVYIEDSDSNRMLLERLLEGFENLALRTAATATEGLAILADEAPPDVLLMDLHLPDFPGEKILRDIRTGPNEALRRMPIVVMSADAKPASIERLLDAGANAYLTKPLDLATLLETLHAQTEGREVASARE